MAESPRAQLTATQAWPWAMLLTALVVFGLSAFGASAAHQFSPHDEQQHFDYAYRMGHFDLPEDNPRFAQETLRELACRGIDFDSLRGTSGCIERSLLADEPPYDPARAPDQGYNTAAAAFPTYYFPTGILGRFLDFLGPWDALLAMRFANGAWLVLASVSIMWIARRYQANLFSTVAAVILMATTATVATVSNFVISDAGILGWVALTAAVTDWTFRKLSKTSLAILGAVMVIGITIDKSYATGLTFVGLFALVKFCDGLWPELRNQSFSKQRWLTLGAGVATMFLAVIAAKWMPRILRMIRRFLTEGSGDVLVPLGRDSFFPPTPFSLDLIYQPLLNVVPPLRAGYIPPEFRSNGALVLTAFVGFALIAATLGSWTTENSREPYATFRTAALGTLILAPVAVSVGLWTTGTYWSISSRFVIGVLPPAFATLAIVVRKRSAIITLSTLAAFQAGFFLVNGAKLI